jgi:hypothetical protein
MTTAEGAPSFRSLQRREKTDLYLAGFLNLALCYPPFRKKRAWRRSKKIRLIETLNPLWNDLAAKWMDVHKPEQTVFLSK